MALLTMQFDYPINESCQVGDVAYYQNVTNQTSGFTVAQINTEPIELGIIEQIENVDNNNDGNFEIVEITVDVDPAIKLPTQWLSFIFFGKDRRVNESAVLGYYGELVFENNSREKAEMFSAACEATGNSK